MRGFAHGVRRMKTKPRVTLVNLAQLDWIRRSGRVSVSQSDSRVTKE